MERFEIQFTFTLALVVLLSSREIFANLIEMRNKQNRAKFRSGLPDVNSPAEFRL